MTMPQGVAFRSTLGFVTDGPNTFAELAEFIDDYPTVTAQGNTVGWELITDDLVPQNGDAANDPRIAGATYCNGSGTFRMDLPAAGTYQISVACGHPLSSASVAMEIKDDVLSLGSPVSGTTSAAQRFKDITNTEYTQLTWPTSNTPVNYEFATTIARFLFPPLNPISYISIDRVLGPVRAVVDYQDVAGVGGETLLKVSYRVSFYGDTVTEEIATHTQREIVLEMANAFTVAEWRAEIIAAVQDLATELGLTIAAVDILSLGEVTIPDHTDVSFSPGSFAVLTETYRQLGPHLKMTGSQRMTVEGTGRVRGSN